MEKKNNVIKCIRYSLFVLHLWIGILALVKGSFEIALLCVTVFWFHNILFSLERWNSRFIFFFFSLHDFYVFNGAADYQYI